jgi:thioester reductase-like protein
VDGTREIVKLCCQNGGKTLHYISTNGIFPGGDTYYENADIDRYLPDLGNGYGQSKWVAEKLVQEAHLRGLPVFVYRPGNIGHHSRTGAANPNDFQTLMIRGCLATRCAPEAPEWNFEMTPVDFLTDALVAFAQSPTEVARTFHIVQHPTVPADAVFSRLKTDGFIDGIVSFPEWLEAVRRVARENEDSQLEVLVNSLDDVAGYLTDQSRYHNEKFHASLDRCKLGRPQADLNYYAMLAENRDLCRTS